MASTVVSEAYKFVAHLQGGFAVFQHKIFFGGKPFSMTKKQCRSRLQKLKEQGMPYDQTLACLENWPPEARSASTVH